MKFITRGFFKIRLCSANLTLFLISLFFLTSFGSINAQNHYWEPVEGIYGGEIVDIHDAGDVLYCSTRNNIYKSTDAGESWEKVLKDNSIKEQLSASGKYLYYFDMGSLYRLDIVTNEVAVISTMTVDNYFVDQNLVFRVYRDKVHRSTDYGNSWSFIDVNHSSEAILTKVGSSEYLFSNIYGSDYYVYSNNKGETWQKRGIGDGESIPVKIVSYNNNLYGYKYSGKPELFTSSDKGLTWSQLFTEERINGKIVEFKEYGGNFYVLTESEDIYISEDVGNTWAKLPDANLGKRLANLTIHKNEIFISDLSGIYRYNRGSEIWEMKNNGINELPINCMIEHDGKLYIGTGSQRMYIYDGQNFSYVTLPDTVTTIHKIIPHKSELYVLYGISTYNYTSTFYYLKMDAQYNIIFPSREEIKAYINDIYFTDQNIFYATDYYLYRENISTGSFEKIVLNPEFNRNERVHDIAGKEDTLIITCNGSYVYTSYDQGETWSEYEYHEFFNGQILRDEFGNYYCPGDDGLLYSPDNGKNWELLTIDYYNFNYLQCHQVSQIKNQLYANSGGDFYRATIGEFIWENLTNDSGFNIYNPVYYQGEIYVSIYQNGLNKFKTDSTNILSTNTSYQFGEVTLEWNGSGIGDNYRLQVSEDRYFSQPFIDEAVSDTKYSINYLESNREYFWRVSSITQTWDDNFTETATIFIKSSRDYKIFQNYPNPFNNSTIIRYELPVTSTTNIEVFATDGSRVKSVSLAKESAGTHKYELDMTGFTSGVYLVRVTAGEFSKTLKTVYLK